MALRGLVRTTSRWQNVRGLGMGCGTTCWKQTFATVRPSSCACGVVALKLELYKPYKPDINTGNPKPYTLYSYAAHVPASWGAES